MKQKEDEQTIMQINKQLEDSNAQNRKLLEQIEVYEEDFERHERD